MKTATMDSAQLMGEQKISRLLIRFSVPAVTGMMVQALYNVVDRIYIGRAVGTVGIGATTIAMPIMMIGFAFALMIGIGANSLVSIHLGEQKREKAEHVIGNAVVLLLIAGIGLTTFGLLFATPALRFFGATDTILPYAYDYIRIIMIGWIIQTLGFGLNNFIRGEGNPKIAMMTMLIGAVANMILDPIFIFGLGWGMKGAAIATVLAHVISTIWVLTYFLGQKSLLKIRYKYLRLEKDIVVRILTVGGAPFLMHITDSGMAAVVNTQLKNHGGDLGISMLGVIISLMMMIFMFVVGVAQGSQPIIGYNYGAEQYDRIKQTLSKAIFVVTCGVLVAWALTMLFPTQLVQIFVKDDEALIQLGERALRLYFLVLPLIGFQIISSMFFQAIGKAKMSMFLVLSRTVLFQAPCILILPHFFGLDGVWVTVPISMTASSLLTGSLLFYTLRQLSKKQPKK